MYFLRWKSPNPYNRKAKKPGKFEYSVFPEVLLTTRASTEIHIVLLMLSALNLEKKHENEATKARAAFSIQIS